MGTNLAMAAMAAGLIYLMGLSAFLWVYLPITIMASSIGVWLFYVQHQFEEAHWDQPEDWDLHEAALHGSSHYVLPQPLRWLTANIGVHHIHHLYSRIPYYRLYDVLGGLLAVVVYLNRDMFGLTRGGCDWMGADEIGEDGSRKWICNRHGTIVVTEDGSDFSALFE